MAMATSITITLPDGSQRTFDGPVTVRQIAESIGPGLAKAALAGKIGSRIVDLETPVESDAEVSILTSRSPEALEVLRHSCTHLMAQAIKRLYPNAMLEDGPPTEEGFWYDIKTEPVVTPEDFERIEAEMWKIVGEDLPIRRHVFSRQEALEKFSARGEKYKIDLINRIPEGDTISAYEQGEFLDLCRGPHVPRTGVFKAFKLLSTAGAYWKGDARNDQLTRIRGTAFHDKKELKEWLRIQEEAQKRNHRKLGRELELFMHHEWAPGETFWLPKGKLLYDILMDMSQRLHRSEGYNEVFTPQLFRKELFETSGHWKHYRDDMFIVPGQEKHELTAEEIVEWGDRLEAELRDDGCGCHGKELLEATGKAASAAERLSILLGPTSPLASRHWYLFEKKAGSFIHLTSEGDEIYAMKPMNCPSHMLIFRERRRSYRELPFRINDMGVLHRNEASGTLSGLTRVRQFCQDDAHIFLDDSMITDEVTRVIGLVRRVYHVVGMEFASVHLSTRPEKAMGTKEQWDLAEAALQRAIEANGMPFTINHGDGAFYGPKIDFKVRDCLGREFQVATIQLDYLLPQRFGLEFTAADGSSKTPVVIHRALFGSYERFIGILIEHFAGAFPVWLAPEQVRVMSISEKHVDYARKVHEALLRADVRSHLDVRDDKIGAKIREGQLAKVPYMLVVGEKEAETGSVAVRTREKGDEGSVALEGFIARIDPEKRRDF
jgi:threonyl-tRNA synthetase